MYKIYADSTLIYDSTLEEDKIGKGVVTLETNKSGSFVFSIYPDHFYYDEFIKLKTVVTVYKSGRIVFRGRVLSDVSDYWNNKIITCEGEMGFLRDSIIRPFSITGTPAEVVTKFVNEHNAQVGEFKRFKIGAVTVAPESSVVRVNAEYASALSNLTGLIEDALGGYLYITHGEDGTDPIPTLNYLADFTKISSQAIEFGSNLRNYTKTTSGTDIITALIPLGARVDDGNSDTEDPHLTIAGINGGKDYVYSESGVALRDWIFGTVIWEDITDASALKARAEEYLESMINQNITINLNAIDLHLLDRSIESFNVCEYVRCVSAPHNFDQTMLCTKQTIDLLKPENDSITLGYAYSSFTETTSRVSSTISKVSSVPAQVSQVTTIVTNMETKVDKLPIKSMTVSVSEFTWTASGSGMYFLTVKTLEELGLGGKAIAGVYISGWADMPATALVTPYISGGELRLMATAEISPSSIEITVSYQ